MGKRHPGSIKKADEQWPKIKNNNPESLEFKLSPVNPGLFVSKHACSLYAAHQRIIPSNIPVT